MRFTSPRKRQTPAVIIVALIDILIVLLIFVMVTTTFKHQDSAIKLALPESSHASTAEDPSPGIIVIEVLKDPPHLSYQGIPIAYDKLKARLREAVIGNSDTMLFVKADKEAPWGEIVKVRDAAKDANIKVVKALTEKTVDQ